MKKGTPVRSATTCVRTSFWGRKSARQSPCYSSGCCVVVGGDTELGGGGRRARQQNQWFS
jgi:hypothetical protein